MESAIVQHLNPQFEPVAVVWSNSIPDESIQFKKGKFGCTLYLFAEASSNGKATKARQRHPELALARSHDNRNA